MTGKKRMTVILLIVLCLGALAAGLYLALRLGLVWALVGATLLVVVVGFIAQAGGILSREGTK